MAENSILERLDALSQNLAVQQSWQDLVQNRNQAAAVAYRVGRTDLFHQYSEEAIAVAKQHGFQRLELDARFRRYQYLLMLDLSGRTLDELRQELNCDLDESGEPNIAGQMNGQIEQYASEAIAAYDRLLAVSAHLSTTTIEAVKLCRQKAVAFSLAMRVGQFDEALELLGNEGNNVPEVKKLLHDSATSAREDSRRICDGLRIDLFLLAAELWRKLDSPDIVQIIFKKVEHLTRSLPGKRCNLCMAWADFCETRGKLADAEKHAREAVDAADQANMVQLKAQAVTQLNSLLARRAGDGSQFQVPEGLGVTDRVMWVVQNVYRALQSKNFELALRLTEQALSQASSPPLRRSVLRVQMIALFELGRISAAESVLDECISLISAELASDAEVVTGSLDRRIIEEENLYLLKAFFRAKAEESIEAWNVAERGRARRLKREMEATKRFAEVSLGDTSFNFTLGWLRSRRAAMISLAATRWGTVALTIGPDEDKPEARILNNFPAGELKRFLPDLSATETDLNLGSEVIEGLSMGIIHPLRERLRAITRSANVLYIIPDSYFYYAPFAVLTLDTSTNGSSLIDLCPLAHTPSAAILSSFNFDRSASRECLAVAVGKDSSGFEFHNHLNQISKASWPIPPVQLQDEAATIERVITEAPHYPAIYFSCHGTVSSETSDLMAASQLMLAGDTALTARDVAKWKLSANLVFLNACQTARFRMQQRSEVNGFVRAFLLAGAKSLIAPLIRVDPQAAGDFAETFFRAWVGGASTAEALRTAQLTARRKDPKAKEWATYCLTGDFR
jgi:tetratricopeptide (TPR) repeat protein